MFSINDGSTGGAAVGAPPAPAEVVMITKIDEEIQSKYWSAKVLY